MNLTLHPVQGIPLISPGDNLASIILDSLQRDGIELQDGDILVLAQKIVSKAEGRLVNLNDIVPSENANHLAAIAEKDPRFVELVIRESKEVLRIRPGLIIVEHKAGFICANAGIDHSNVSALWGKPDDWVLLLPEDADHSAHEIKNTIKKSTHKEIGILIIDSHGRAWRLGIAGLAIGIAGLPALVDMRGKPDLFGYQLRVTQIAVADELAAAASLVMGQANEGTPVVHVRGFPYALGNGSIKDLIRPRDLDLFR